MQKRGEVEIFDIEDLFGSAHDDILVGTYGPNWLFGHYGNDVLDGKEGNDVLLGGAGADVLIGGDGSDAAYYFYSNEGVEVSLHDGVGRGGYAEGDTFPGRQMIEYTDSAGGTREIEVPDIENLYGSYEYDDILIGSHGSNRLIGHKGDDELDGMGGHDLPEGRDGADVLRGGDGNDLASYAYSDEAVEVHLHNGTARGGDAEGDTFPGMKTVEYVNPAGDTVEMEVPDIEDLIGSAHDDILDGAHGPNRLGGYLGDDVLDGREGDDWLDGGPGDDRLYGGIGNDTLQGGPGDDYLRGGPDNDSLAGGEDDDTFSFTPGSGDDIVLDFGNGEDAIDLSDFADIRSVEDLVMQQQESNLVIDLSGQGGGTVTLQDFDMAHLMDAHFVFFMDEGPAIT